MAILNLNKNLGTVAWGLEVRERAPHSFLIVIT